MEPGNSNQFSYLNYRDLRDSRIFTDVIGYRSTLLNLRLMIVVGLCASFVPARRATRVDPMVALREQ